MSGTYEIRRAVTMRTRDGVDLVADVYLPGDGAPVPTLLQRTPYDRSDPFGTQFIVGMNTLRALDAGFAVVIQDTRGRLDSGGDFAPFVHEGADGTDTVAWIRSQDFSDGNVITYGASYVGATQTLLAAEGIEGHVAMAPFLTSADFQASWIYRSGALQLGFVYLWITEALGPLDVEHRGLPEDHPARVLIGSMLADPLAAMEQLPLLNDDMVELAPYLSDWLSGPEPSAWWDAITPSARLNRISTRALHIAGFNDIFLEGSLEAYDELRQRGKNSHVRDGQYLIIGPWSHGNTGDWQGQVWHGYAAAAAALDLPGRQLEFFRAAVEGRSPEMPRATWFTTGTNTWRSGPEWPPASQHQSWYLDSGRRLVHEPPSEGTTAKYTANPADPVPTRGGATFLPGILVNRNDGPQDQAEIEARSDVLTYTTGALTAPLEVTGKVSLALDAASSATDCDWTSRLVDIDPEGRHLGIVDGILRARYRHGSKATPLIPGEREIFDVELGTISHVFASGHRIGLQIASSNFPRFDRNPQTMVDPATATSEDFVPANQTVYHGESRLLLPIVKGAAA